jgi:uncharacterized protein
MRGLSLDAQELRMRAIRWAMYHNGFSGRTARQFVDFLDGELAAGPESPRLPAPPV